MKKAYLTVVLTLTCLLGLGISARAQAASGVVVTVPFEFVAGGKTLPAGTYSVGRVSAAVHPGLIIRSNDNGALVLPTVFEGTPGEQSKLGFEHVGDKYFLSKVETRAGIYTFAIPRAMTRVAKVKDGGTLSSSGAN